MLPRSEEEKKKLSRRRSLRTFLIGAAGAALIISGIYVGQKESEQAYDQYLARARQEDNEQAAVENLKQAQAILHDKSTAFTSEARIYNSHGEYDKTIRLIQRLENEKNFSVKKNPEMFTELADAYFGQEKYDSSLILYAELKDISAATQLEAQIGYAAVLARTGETSGAETESDLLADVLDDDQKSYLLAEIDIARSNLQGAASGFSSLLEATDPDLRRRSVFALALVYQKDGQKTISDGYTREINMLNEAMKNENLNQSSQLYRQLGQAYYERALADNRHNDLYYALDCFRKVINLGDQQEDVYLNLYDTEMQLKAYSSAIKVLEEYEDAFPKDYVPSMLKAQLLLQQEEEKPSGDRDDTAAEKAYEAALKKYRSSLNSITEATPSPSVSPLPSPSASSDPETEFVNEMPEQLKTLYDFFSRQRKEQEEEQ